MTDVGEVIRRRRSARTFIDKKIPPKLLEEMINCGRLAPTARNIQPWEFVIITAKSTKDKIAALADNGRFIASANACIAVLCKPTKYYLEDGCAATENILLSAESLGVNSCWVAGDKKPYCGKIKELLKIPADYSLVSLIALGYSAETPKRPEKITLKELIHWEKF